ASLPSKRQCEPAHKAPRLRTRQRAPQERVAAANVDAAAPTNGLNLKHLALASPIDSRPDTEHGNVGTARSDGRRGAVAVGPAYGPQRDSARLWPGPATAPRQGSWQSLQRVRRRPRSNGAAPEQHGNCAAHEFVRS